MKPVFADTFFYLALLNSRDAHHTRVEAMAHDLARPTVVSEYILLEVGNSFLSGWAVGFSPTSCPRWARCGDHNCPRLGLYLSTGARALCLKTGQELVAHGLHIVRDHA